jgi:hypothetical protein
LIISRKISFEKSVLILFISLILLSGDLINPGISFIASLMLLFFLMIKYHEISSNELILLLPLVLILLTGVISSLFHNILSRPDVIYLLGKDIWYYTKPIVYLLTGLYIFRMNPGKEKFLHLLLYIALLISVHHIIKVIVFITGADPASLVLDRIRYKTGPGNLLEAFALAYTLIFLRKTDTKNNLAFPVWLFILIFSVSIILSFSRTIFLAFLVSLLAMQNFFSFRVKIFIRSVIIIMVIIIVAILTMRYVNNVSDKNSFIHAMTEKYLNSINEITYEKSNPTYKEINENWRGLETRITEAEIKRGGITERIFGFGFGKTVFIGYEGLQGIDDRNIPKFHNGFIELLLKTGYAGLLLYILFFFVAFRVADNSIPPGETDKFLKAILFTSFVCTLVITGLYNKSAFDPACLVTGYLMGFSLIRSRKKTEVSDK